MTLRVCQGAICQGAQQVAFGVPCHKCAEVVQTEQAEKEGSLRLPSTQVVFSQRVDFLAPDPKRP